MQSTSRKSKRTLFTSTKGNAPVCFDVPAWMVTPGKKTDQLFLTWLVRQETEEYLQQLLVPDNSLMQDVPTMFPLVPFAPAKATVPETQDVPEQKITVSDPQAEEFLTWLTRKSIAKSYKKKLRRKEKENKRMSEEIHQELGEKKLSLNKSKGATPPTSPLSSSPSLSPSLSPSHSPSPSSPLSTSASERRALSPHSSLASLPAPLPVPPKPLFVKKIYEKWPKYTIPFATSSILEFCGVPPFLTCLFHRKLGGHLKIGRKPFLKFYKSYIHNQPPPTKLFHIISSPSSPQVIGPDDLVILLEELLETHPTLRWLLDEQEARATYIRVVVSSIFYWLDSSSYLYTTPSPPPSSPTSPGFPPRTSDRGPRIYLKDFLSEKSKPFINALYTIMNITDVTYEPQFFNYSWYYVIHSKFRELNSSKKPFLTYQDFLGYSKGNFMQNSLEKAFHVFNFPTVELRVNLGLRNPEDEKKEEEEYNRKKKRKEKLKVEITKKLGVVNHGEQSVGNYEGGIPDPTLDDDLDESNDEEETNEFLREKMEAKELEDYDVSDFSSDDEIVETDDILDDDIDDSESDEESDADKIKILEKNKTTKSSSVPPTTTGHPTPTTLTTTTSSVAQPEGIQAKRRTIQKREKPARKMRLKPKENANEEDSINKKKEKKEEGLVLSSRLQRHEKTTFSLEDFVWFLMSDVDKTTLKSQYLWFVCLDEDFDGILSLMDIYMLYTEFVEKCSKNFVSVARIVSFQNFLMLLNDAISPEIPFETTLGGAVLSTGRITLGDLRRSIIRLKNKNSHRQPYALISTILDVLLKFSNFIEFASTDPTAWIGNLMDQIGNSSWSNYVAKEYSAALQLHNQLPQNQTNDANKKKAISDTKPSAKS